MREQLPDFGDDRLSALLDGELDDAERKDVEAALARDADLRAELDALRRTREFLRKRGPVEAPPDFLEKVLAKVEHEPVPANAPMSSFFRRPFGLPIEAFAIAAAALLVVVGGVGGLGLLSSGGQVSALPKSDEDTKVTKEVAPPRPAAQQMVDPTVDEEPEPQRQIDLQGVQYGDRSFGAGVTSRDLGVGTGVTSIAGKEGEGATLQDFAPGTAEAPPTASPSTTAAASTAPAEAPTPALSSWRYVVTSDRDEVLADLQAIAAKSGGSLRDRQGNAVNGGSTEGGTFLLVVPADRVASVDTWLAKLGSERAGSVDASLYPSGFVAIQVDVLRFAQYNELTPTKPLPPQKKGTPAQ